MKIKYKTFSFRLNEDTVDLMREMRAAHGISWNRFIYSILKDHASLPHNKMYYREGVFKPKYKVYKKDSCEICGKKDKKIDVSSGKILHVHHIDGDIMNNNPENLQTLCPSCHGTQWPR